MTTSTLARWLRGAAVTAALAVAGAAAAQNVTPAAAPSGVPPPSPASTRTAAPVLSTDTAALPVDEVASPTPSAVVPPHAFGAADTNTQRLIALKFNQAPISQVLQFYSEITGRTMLEAPGQSAVTITLRSQTRLTPQECLQAIRTVLQMNNVGLIEVGDKFAKVVAVANVQQEGLHIESNTWAQVVHPETDTLISEIIPLRYIELADAQKVVAGLVHTYGKIVPLERINSLLIADAAINLNRIREVLGQIDQPIEAREKLSVLPVRYAKASDVKTKIEEILADDKNKAPAATVPRARTSGPPGMEATRAPLTIPGVIRALRPPLATPTPGVGEETTEDGRLIRGSVKIVADDRTGVLIILTRAENMPFFEKIVAALDVATQPDVIVKVIRLEYADVETVATMLNTLIGAQTPKELLTPRPSGLSTLGGTTPTDITTGRPATPPTPEPARPSASLESYLSQAQRNAASSAEGKAAVGQLSALNIKVLPDKRSNALVVMAPRTDLATIEDLIKDMDIQLSQVLIEAVIVEVQLDKKNTSGVDWLQRSMIAYNRNANGSRSALFGYAGTAGGGQSQPLDATSIKTTDGLPLASGLSYYTTFFGLNVDAVLTMVASDSRSRVLASPVIMTLDNAEATIDVSQERYFYTGSVPVTGLNGGTTYQTQTQTKRVGIKLVVKPHINQKKFVNMDIKQTIDDVQEPGQLIDTGTGSQYWPTVGSRQLSATIAVQNGETIVLGGLVQNNAGTSQSGVPILSRIPILGYLFRSDSDTKSRTEVIVFMTPHVLDTPEEIAANARRVRSHSAIGDMWRYGWSGSKLADSYSNAVPRRMEPFVAHPLVPLEPAEAEAAVPRAPALPADTNATRRPARR